uniref:RNA helicase n=1 Tax=Chromera velia CCMP2878 TaxID=1169474 RepID=A0A0G4FBL8_9ALVE|eukprot:Cvel_16209.t1-p1 / transcript=Cvel_16209.t1 / gene=Cvel_16209 / organism=Chromera_velia_CCMP2878 / gene_product=Putative ATP-dependent RNA helicase DHX33, putative / transcript_product=Putative ATP-dependent RNA helicase DHX33, putative / location=Cvel_scaffold1238:34507-40863(+) / protein_length=844 / sequence_SO=supercontig / SO=protein_coding / is_pseudo=false
MSSSTLSELQSQLPIRQNKEEIVRRLKSLENQVMILIGETGSGKTTQVPQFVYDIVTEEARTLRQRAKMIAITQPRRIAAISVAKRVAFEMKCELGELVGYQVRFEERVSRETRIKFMTDGMLVRELMLDQDLKRCSFVLLDEAHERSLHSDILLGFLKTLLNRRKDLKLIVMSATLHPEVFIDFFGGADVLKVPGRSHKVHIRCLPRAEDDHVEAALMAVLQIHRDNPMPPSASSSSSSSFSLFAPDSEEPRKKRKRGADSDKKGKAGYDILVFLPGQGDIEALQARLNEKREVMAQARAEMVEEKLQEILRAERGETSGTGKKEAASEPGSKEKVAAVKRDDRENNTGSPQMDFLPGLRKRKLDSEGESEKSTTETTAEANGKNVTVEGQGGQEEEQGGQEVKDQRRAASERRINAIRKKIQTPWDADILVLPIYAALPLEEQQKVFQPAPPNTRKVVLATNIAETSLTVPGISFVVDTGLAKVKQFKPASMSDQLVQVQVAKANVMQRAGRAGREGPGNALWLFTEDDFHSRPEQMEPEILRCDLDHVFLELKALKVDNPIKFPFVSVPSKEYLRAAAHKLLKLGALDKKGNLTEIGQKMAVLPVTPVCGLLLIESVSLECAAEMLTIVSMLSAEVRIEEPKRLQGAERKAFETRMKKLRHPESDHLTLLRVYNTWHQLPKDAEKFRFCKEHGVNSGSLLKAKSIREQLKSLMLQQFQLKSITSGGNNWEVIRKCLCRGLFLNSAVLVRGGGAMGFSGADSEDGRGPGRGMTGGRVYETKATRTEAKIHPNSVLFHSQKAPKCIVFSELIGYLCREVTVVDERWLVEIPTFREVPVGGAHA